MAPLAFILSSLALTVRSLSLPPSDFLQKSSLTTTPRSSPAGLGSIGGSLEEVQVNLVAHQLAIIRLLNQSTTEPVVRDDDCEGGSEREVLEEVRKMQNNMATMHGELVATLRQITASQHQHLDTPTVINCRGWTRGDYEPTWDSLVSGWTRGDYEPTWDSLDTRPLPVWYDDAKVGIFIHWGVFSVPSFGSEWFWEYWQGSKNPSYVEFMEKNFRPNFAYPDFAPHFTAEFYNPESWAEVFNASGARYIVLTSKHHEGFTNWPSSVSWNWNSMDVGPKRDLVGDLAKAIKSKTPHIHFGLYHSLYEWFNPLYLHDKENSFSSNYFVEAKTMPELYELVNNYEPEVIWSDGDWEAHDWYWNSTVFLAWLFNSSPVKDTVVVNDRWGIGVTCKHGSYYTCSDRYNPGVLQDHKWENAMTLDKSSWGYRREATLSDYLSIHDLLTTLAQTISCGGNLLVNVGPTHDGRIPPIMEERLKQLGAWLDINGDSVYNTRPWRHQNDTLTPGVWYTSNGDRVYAMVLNWPDQDVLKLGSVLTTDHTNITMLGYGHIGPTQLQFSQWEDSATQVTFPPMSQVASQWVWVLDMFGVNPA